MLCVEMARACNGCRIVLGCVLAALILSLWSFQRNPDWEFYRHEPSELGQVVTSSSTSSTTNFTSPVRLVIASMIGDDTTWMKKAFPEWDAQVYVTDDRAAKYSVQANKGRESMAYLTYIIDNYESLPDISIFRHADRYQWHSDDPLYDGERVLKRLQLNYVESQGFVNLRCVWVLGCPVEIRPFVEEVAPGIITDNSGAYYRRAFEHLFPDVPVPNEVGISCCAEFAVTRAKIRTRPVTDYIRYRDWLLKTDLIDHISGRILEYSWQIIFGMGDVFCPNAQECYCKTFGLCDLTCESKGACHSQYTLPAFSTMPKGWPDYGWHGEWQDASVM